MVAAPQNATATFKGASGRLYTIDVYLSDVANAAVNWNPNGSAGTASLNSWRAPEQVVLMDFSIPTGMTDTKSVIFTQDGANVAGSAVRFANQLNTLPFRPSLAVRFPAGALVGANQLA